MNDNKIMVWMSMLWPMWGTIQYLLDSVGGGKEREINRQRHTKPNYKRTSMQHISKTNGGW